MAKIPIEERKLNEEQKKAVEYGEGPLLIIAGAGTGKTTVVTERIKHLITKDFAKPHEILALTFTEKAAREMETRVDEAMPYGYTQMWISTFHAFCERILRSEALHIGLSPVVKLLPQTEATMLLRRNLFSLDLDYFRPLGNPNKFIGGMLQHFSRLKDEDISPIQYLEWAQNQKSKIKNQNVEERLEIKKNIELARAYEFYEELKIKENLMDFSDLISHTLNLFRSRPNILGKYQEQFKFILIDEFQDTNIAQYELIKLLAPSKLKPNLTVVGDDNQSIYKFRGAAVSNILYFIKDYKGSQQVILNQNYRSYQFILDCSYKLIKNNDPDTLEKKMGISKRLLSVRKDAEKDKSRNVKFIHADRVENEAEMVAKEIKRLTAVDENPSSLQKIYSWKDFAILVRANNHADAFIRALGRLGIPYQFLGPGQLLRQPEIKELIAYLQILHDITDNAALFKVLNMEFFDISARDIASLISITKKYNLFLFETCEIICGKRFATGISLPYVSEDAKNKINRLVDMIIRHLKLKRHETAGQLLYFFLEDTGILKNILDFKFPLTERKAENITKFFSKLKSYEAEHEDAGVASVLDWLMMSLELGESPVAAESDWTEVDAVNILTVHSAKGLEFAVVILVNLVSQRFPTTEKSEQIPIPDELIKEVLPEGDAHLEEERRLFYVGMTRARDLLYLTAADFYSEGKKVKKISPFVVEALGEKAISKAPVFAESQLSLLDWRKEVTKEKVTGSNLKISYLSYSQIEAFRTCPLHFKLRYLLNLPTPPTPALVFGQSLHATLKDFYEAVRTGKKVTLKLLFELLQKNWLREGYSEKKYEVAMFKKGERFLQGYFEKEFDGRVKTVLLEGNFRVPIAPNFKIGGKIDRIDEKSGGKIEIIDYKTGRMPGKREIDHSLQLSMYAMAANLLPYPPFQKKTEDIMLTLYYFDTQEKITTFRSMGQLEEEKTKILQIAREIETSDFRCSGSQICRSCEYKLFCGEPDDK